MPTAKPRYIGNGGGAKPPEFSEGLRTELRKYYPDKTPQQPSPLAQTADEFVNVILAEASWAMNELYWDRFTSTKQELRAAQADLLSVLKAARDKLLNLPPDFDRLLGTNADPLGCADELAALIAKIDAVGCTIDDLSTRRKLSERQHRVAVEMTIRILRVLCKYEIPPSATANADLDRQSDAVRILKAIGDDIGLTLSAVTWRDMVMEAKNQAPDLRPRP
jgi:hypothetical protein